MCRGCAGWSVRGAEGSQAQTRRGGREVVAVQSACTEEIEEVLDGRGAFSGFRKSRKSRGDADSAMDPCVMHGQHTNTRLHVQIQALWRAGGGLRFHPKLSQLAALLTTEKQGQCQRALWSEHACRRPSQHSAKLPMASPMPRVRGLLTAVNKHEPIAPRLRVRSGCNSRPIRLSPHSAPYPRKEETQLPAMAIVSCHMDHI